MLIYNKYGRLYVDYKLMILKGNKVKVITTFFIGNSVAEHLDPLLTSR